MNRRSFFMSLMGGIAAASVGGLAFTKSVEAAPLPIDSSDVAGADLKTLDETDAAYAQMGPRSRMRMRRRRQMRRMRRSPRQTGSYPYNNDRRTRPER